MDGNCDESIDVNMCCLCFMYYDEDTTAQMPAVVYA